MRLCVNYYNDARYSLIFALARYTKSFSLFYIGIYLGVLTSLNVREIMM